jgi:hypothetical protein
MSVGKIISVHCDSCGQWADRPTGGTATQMRAALHRGGWRTLPGGKDICNECRAKDGA